MTRAKSARYPLVVSEAPRDHAAIETGSECDGTKWAMTCVDTGETDDKRLDYHCGIDRITFVRDGAAVF